MKSLFIEHEFPYDGTQLRSLFGYLDHKIMGDSIVSWIGPCSVSFDHMVDGEDFIAGETIEGSRMLHLVIEKFHAPLIAGVAIQRLFASICLDLLRDHLEEAGLGNHLCREGDDLYFNDGKLSISIATVSPVSTLIHFAINCSNEGTPVQTASFEDLGIEPEDFAREALDAFVREMNSIEEATVKVRWVK